MGFIALVAQSVERNHGKVEVCGPIPHGGFTDKGSKEKCLLEVKIKMSKNRN